MSETGGPASYDSQISRATEGVRALVLSGEFRPEERIPEIPVAAKLGVSRSPLRLALERLAHEGLIRALPKGGFAVCGFTIDDIWDAVETRGVLEGAAARLAAERDLSPSQIEPLLGNNQEVEAILNSDLFTDKYLELNRAFHTHIVELAGNEALKRAIQRVSQLPFTAPGALVVLYKNVPASKQLIPISREHHTAIVEAIAQRQSARAESVVREHSRLARRILELALPDWHLIRSIPGANLITFRES